MAGLYKKPVLPVILLWIAILLCSCGRTSQPQENIFLSTTVTPTADMSFDVEVYPASPEAVVSMFLEVYAGTPERGIHYLSSSLVSRLDEAKASNLLPQQNEISGYIITQGSASAEASRSEIQVEIAYGNVSYSVEFSLIIEDGRWAIDEIFTG